MGKHQIIYTSCMRGINGVNDGQQVFSYDVDFRDSASESVKALFSYQAPSLKAGEAMTEQLAGTMPQIFQYRRLANGSCAIALNTYLGRDYMGEGGRFGNHLSHAVICNEEEINNYPCEFYESGLLRSRMEFSEVNSSEKPAYLPEPVLAKGGRVSIARVQEFLSIDGRMGLYRKMLFAVLSYESARKRLVICDMPENIILWIAAIHYALPLKIALNVSFATYEFDPSLSISQICGVIPDGTRYEPSSADSHFSFDFYRNEFPKIDAKGDFFDFIEMSMSISYESLQDFHVFASVNINYSKADEHYMHMYSLYCLLTDGLRGLSLDAFKNAVYISNRYASDDAKAALSKKLLSEKDFLMTSSEAYSLEAIKALLENISLVSGKSYELIKRLIALRLTSSLGVSDEISFGRFYIELDSLCAKKNISLPFELMNPANRDGLLRVLMSEGAPWKWEFIVGIACSYIAVEKSLPSQLSMEFPIGQLIGGIITSAYYLGEDLALSIISIIIDKFTDNWEYLVNMVFNIEGILLDIQGAESLTSNLWVCFNNAVWKNKAINRQNIYSFLLSYGRSEEAFSLYSCLVKRAGSIEEAKGLFIELSEISNSKHFLAYEKEIFEACYSFINASKEQSAPLAKQWLLDIAIDKGLAPDFAEDLVNSATSMIPISLPTKENGLIIAKLLRYCQKYINGPLPWRLLLLTSGMILSDVKGMGHIGEIEKRLKALTGNKKIDLSKDSKDTEKFIEWAAPNLFASCASPKELISAYSLFSMPKEVFGLFVSACSKEALKESKGGKGYKRALDFLGFIFAVGGADNKAVGQAFRKLGKQKLENLDAQIKNEFQNNADWLMEWDEIRETALAAKPLLDSIGSLFKKKA